MANESKFDANTLKVLRAVARNHYPVPLYTEVHIRLHLSYSR